MYFRLLAIGSMPLRNDDIFKAGITHNPNKYNTHSNRNKN